MLRKSFIGVLLILFMFAGSYVYAQQAKDVITPEAVHKLIDKDTSVVILDVRTSAEFKSETGHLSKAILIPLQELDKRADELKKYQKRLIIAYCRTGHRSGIAAAMLKKLGYKVSNMEGGITRWNAEKLPVVKESNNKLNE